MKILDCMSAHLRSSLLGIALAFIIVPYGTTVVAQGNGEPPIGESFSETVEQILQVISNKERTNNGNESDVVPSQADGPVYPVPPELEGGGSGPDTDRDGIPDSIDLCPNEANHEKCLSKYVVLSTIVNAADAVRKFLAKVQHLLARMEAASGASIRPGPAFPEHDEEWVNRWNSEIQPELDKLEASLDHELDKSILGGIQTCSDLEDWNTALGWITWGLVILGIVSFIGGLVLPPTAPILWTTAVVLILAGIAVAALDSDVDRAYVDLCKRGT